MGKPNRQVRGNVSFGSFSTEMGYPRHVRFPLIATQSALRICAKSGQVKGTRQFTLLRTSPYLFRGVASTSVDEAVANLE